MAAEDKKMVVLRSSDGKEFEVEAAVAMMSQLIKAMIEEGCGGVIPVPNVTGRILAKILEYCERHAERVAQNLSDDEEEIRVFNCNYVKVDQNTLFDLIVASNFLNINGLLDLTCKTVADMMKGKSPEEIRHIFHIKNDYSPKEEAKVRKENAWAFK